MTLLGFVAFALTLLWVNTEFVTRNCYTEFPTPNYKNPWIHKRHKVYKQNYDDG